MAERAHGRLCGWGGQWRHVTSGRAAQEIKAANSKRRQVEEQMEQLRQREGALASRVEAAFHEAVRRVSAPPLTADEAAGEDAVAETLSLSADASPESLLVPPPPLILIGHAASLTPY